MSSVPVNPIPLVERLPGDVLVTWTERTRGPGWTIDSHQNLVSWKVCTQAGEPVPDPCWAFRMDWSRLEPEDIGPEGWVSLEIRWP